MQIYHLPFLLFLHYWKLAKQLAVCYDTIICHIMIKYSNIETSKPKCTTHTWAPRCCQNRPVRPGEQWLPGRDYLAIFSSSEGQATATLRRSRPRPPSPQSLNALWIHEAVGPATMCVLLLNKLSGRGLWTWLWDRSPELLWVIWELN